MSPLAVDPRDQLFRAMLALSVGFHVALFVGFVLWGSFSKPAPKFISVTVVDLVGGSGFEPRSEQAEARPAPPVKGRSRDRVPVAPRAKTARERTAKKEAVRVPKAVHPDTRDLSDRIRKLRAEKSSEETVREALQTLRREKEARAAVDDLRARRVDLSALPSPPAKVPSRPGGIPGGGSVTTGVSPEQLEYFSALYEKVYTNWILVVPPERRAGAETLIAVVRVKIEKTGKVMDVELEKSSGNRYFDDSVLRAISKASPLPAPPEKLRGKEDHYEVGFRFRPPRKGEW